MNKLLDVIGFIKIDPNNQERIDYLNVIIQSYAFLKDKINLILSLEYNENFPLYQWNKLLNIFESNNIILKTCYSFPYNYGNYYSTLINIFSETNYILNFMEDHFMLIDDSTKIERLINDMEKHNIEVALTSFHKINLNSLSRMHPDSYKPIRSGWYFENNRGNFTDYQKYYGSRYYIGVNAIFRKDFALKFWGRPIQSKRPHEYEIATFDQNFMHKVLIPDFEIQASIDDDHGEPDSCLLNRNEPKFKKIWNLIEMNRG